MVLHDMILIATGIEGEYVFYVSHKIKKLSHIQNFCADNNHLKITDM